MWKGLSIATAWISLCIIACVTNTPFLIILGLPATLFIIGGYDE